MDGLELMMYLVFVMLYIKGASACSEPLSVELPILFIFDRLSIPSINEQASPSE
jgi:hypothetical protein